MSDIVLETPRLILRKLTLDDIKNIKEQLQDPKVMFAYEGPFSDDLVKSWMAKQLERYEDYGFALNAVIRKEDNVFLGQCGITMQDVDGLMVHEVGYLFSSQYWKNGYAREAACACRDYAFKKLKAPNVYAIIRDINEASKAVAKAMNMSLIGTTIKHYRGCSLKHEIFKISRQEWETLEFNKLN